jgi:phosphatidylglycerol:prolipoprotein diacylglycerol transferase
MMALSFLVTTLLAGPRFRRFGWDPERASEIGLGAMIGGVLGAKIYYLLDHVPDLMRDPGGMIFSGSGLTWYGGLLGGVAGSLFVAWRRRVPILALCDVAAPLLGLGYAIGRMGCFLNGDDYGRPADVPWAMAFPKGTPPTTVPVHPTQLYEVAGGLLAFFLLSRLDDRRVGTGLPFGLYLVMAGLSRFVVEFYRTNEPLALGFTMAQWISLVLAATGVWLLNRSRNAAGILPR